MKAYDSNSIEVLKGLEAVRKRPGMYIGSTNSRGLHHLVWEIMDNSVDEHLAGFCTEINLILNKDGSLTVSDDGRGIPVGMHSEGYSALRVIFTILHAGGKFSNDSYKVSGGLHGVGASVVNALSSWLEVEVHRDGKIHKDRYENGGIPVYELKKGLLPTIGKTDRTGTKTTFMPDATIFETIQFKPEIIKKRLKEVAYLNKGLKIHFVDMNTSEDIMFYEEEGIVGFIKDINKSKELLFDSVVYVTGSSDSIEMECAIQYTKEYSTESVLSFCNNINTIEGGTHVSGFKAALTRIVNQYARELGMLKEKDINFEGRDVRNGLTAIVLLKHPTPQYEGQTKTKLGNSNAKSAVEEILGTELPKFFDRNVEITKEIISNALKCQSLRKAEENLRTKLLNKTYALTSNGKLAACKSKDPEKTEVVIVEGDSAGGSAKQGRDREYQAILPLKGKILNVEKQSIAKIVEDTEIATLISVLGCGFGEGYGEDFDITKLKYAKIILLTDADVDGSHINTLILTLIYRYMTELIYAGKVFLGMPPLYKIKQGSVEIYFYDDHELTHFKNYMSGQITLKALEKQEKLNAEQLKILKKFSPSKPHDTQRYKGLGEMNPEQLWDTTLNPKTRYLKKITIEDAILAEEVTVLLMGSKVPPRKEFIMEEAVNANVDL